MNFFWALLKTSIRASISVRGAFLLQMGLIIGSTAVYLAIWWIFFREFREIRGWQFEDMMIMMAIVLGGYGLNKVCFGGIKHITKTVVTGNLDPFMTQPKNILLHLITSRSQPKGWGQIVTSVVLMGSTIPLKWIPLTLILIFFVFVIVSSSGVLAHTVVFWLGPMEEISNKYNDSLFLFLHYPANIYSGALKFMMFTVFPVGIIGCLPVELIKQFSWTNFLILAGSVSIFCFFAFTVFYRGLKKYESGNQFGIRF